jgi:hypothetical protein
MTTTDPPSNKIREYIIILRHCLPLWLLSKHRLKLIARQAAKMDVVSVGKSHDLRPIWTRASRALIYTAYELAPPFLNLHSSPFFATDTSFKPSLTLLN